jgi:hypothetical protein
MATVQLTQKEHDVDQRIETIAKLLARKGDVDMKAHRRIAKEWFMSIHDSYYLDYIARRRRDIRRIVVSPSYVVVEIKSRSSDIYNKYYVIGVDYDSGALFVNRVNYVDMYGFYLVKLDRVGDMSIIYTHDDVIRKNVFNYDYDVTEPRYAIEHAGRYRVQGDIVFDISELDLSAQVPAWALHEIYRYFRYLVLDRIAAVLNDHGISYVVGQVAPNRRNTEFGLAIMGGADSSRWSKFTRRNIARVVKILSEYFDMNCKDFTTSVSCMLKLTIDNMPLSANIETRPDTRFGHHIGNTVIVVREAGDWETVNLFARDIVEQFHNLPKNDVVRYIGNHRIELHRVVPVRFAYEPRIRPLVLEPQTIYVVLNDTYVVDSDTLVELIHREHGQRYIWFGNKFVLRIERVRVHPEDVAERSRVALRRMEPYKL